MKPIYLFFSLIFLISCTSIKSTQKSINSGNYTKAINSAVGKLVKDKYSKKSKAYADLLFEAFDKYQAQQLNRIDFFNQDNAFDNAGKIFSAYNNLKIYQNKIKPLLPLEGTNTQLNFSFFDVDAKLIKAKSAYADALFEEALDLINTQQMQESRNAYENLKKIQDLEPSYPRLKETMDIAYQNGLSFVFINLENSTQMVVPKAFEEKLLSLNTYNLDDFWTVYHNTKLPNNYYDREILIDFQNFNYSPDRLLDREINIQREVVDGWQYQVDSRGNFVLDADGNKIKEDKMVTVEGVLFKSIQSKEVEVIANVTFTNLANQQEVLSRPLQSVFVFENNFATYQGDIRALNREEKQLLRGRLINYPSNETMLIDAANDIKLKLKSILKNNI